MKFSDVMLDLETGDASIHDAYIQEAVGKVNVSAAIFETADMILEQLEFGEEIEDYVQEAANNAGIPTDTEGATNLAGEAVGRQLTSFYDVIVTTAKKVKESTERDLKTLIAIGKNYGISSSAIEGGNFVSVFAQPLAKALVENAGKRSANGRAFRNAAFGIPIAGVGAFGLNRTSKKEYWSKGFLILSGKRFLKSKYAIKIAKNYGKGMASLIGSYGLDIGYAFSDKTVQTFLGLNEQTLGGKIASDILASFRVDPVVKAKTITGYRTKAAGTLRQISTHISSGSRLIKFDKTIDRNTHYTNRLREEDIVEYLVALFAIFNISKAVVDTLDKEENRKNSKQAISNICMIANHNHAKKSLSEDAKEASVHVTNISNNIVKAFNDSTYAVGAVVSGKDTPQTQSES